jgi:aspartyl protease
MAEMRVDRRGLLRRVGVVAGAAAVVPLLGGVGVAAGVDAAGADALFQAGELAAAERGYRRLWAEDPMDAHVASQLGDLALLSDRCDEAERWLRTALRLAPGDGVSQRLLAECYLRRDRLAEARPLLPAPDAAQLAAVTGIPYAISGTAARVPWLDVDPLPHLTASVNGVSGTFVLDTGAAQLTLSTDAADRAGLEAVASASGAIINGQPVTTYLGVAGSLRLGAVEVRNVPVTWLDGDALALPNGLRPDGTIGASIFYRFLTTLDYRHRALLLQPKRTTAPRPGRQMWLADHLPCAEATLNGYGPRIAAMDTGGLGVGLNTSAAIAAKAGIDTTQPPVTVDRIGLAGAVNRHVPATIGDMPWEGMTRFSTIGNVTHEFYKPFAVTFDFARMRLSVV